MVVRMSNVVILRNILLWFLDYIILVISNFNFMLLDYCCCFVSSFEYEFLFLYCENGLSLEGIFGSCIGSLVFFYLMILIFLVWVGCFFIVYYVVFFIELII